MSTVHLDHAGVGSVIGSLRALVGAVQTTRSRVRLTGGDLGPDLDPLVADLVERWSDHEQARGEATAVLADALAAQQDTVRGVDRRLVL